MRSLKNTHLALAALILMMPAIVLCSLGMLYTVFGIEQANETLDHLLTIYVFRLLFSPVMILGGMLLAIFLNFSRIFRFHFDKEIGIATVSITIQNAMSNLLITSLGIALMFIIFAYLIGENCAGALVHVM